MVITHKEKEIKKEAGKEEIISKRYSLLILIILVDRYLSWMLRFIRDMLILKIVKIMKSLFMMNIQVTVV